MTNINDPNVLTVLKENNYPIIHMSEEDLVTCGSIAHLLADMLDDELDGKVNGNFFSDDGEAFDMSNPRTQFAFKILRMIKEHVLNVH